MKIKTLVFAGAVSVMFGAAMAGDDSAALQLARKTVASKNYVDGTFATKNYTDSTFQTKIPAAASGLTQMFGGGGMVLAAGDTDGVVAPRLIIPGYKDGQQAEISRVFNQWGDDFGLTNNNMDDIDGVIDDLYHEATGEWLPYAGRYSIPSMEFILEELRPIKERLQDFVWDGSTGFHEEWALMGPTRQFAMVPDLSVNLTTTARNVPIEHELFGGNITSQNWNTSRDGDLYGAVPSLGLVGELVSPIRTAVEGKQNKIPAAASGLSSMFGNGGQVLASTSDDGVVAPRLILPGFNNNQQAEFSRAVRQQQHDWLNWSYGQWGDIDAMIDDMYHYVTGEWLPYAAGRYSIPSMELLVEFLSIVNDRKQDKITAHAANAADSVLTDSATAGTVQKRAIYDGSATYAAATHSTQIPTMGGVMAGVAAYVDAHSPTIPAPTGDCLNAANHCALVTTYANGTITYNWTVMAK